MGVGVKLPDFWAGVRMRAKDIMRSHWVGFLFLIPFVVMLAVHRFLGLSDALMIQTPPGEREAHTFNLLMVAAFYLGIAAFLAHAGFLAGRGRFWLYGKLLFLAAYWRGIFFFM